MVQSTSSILMVSPAAFGFDPLSAASNVFQQPTRHNPQHRALAEFDAAIGQLRAAGVNVLVIRDTVVPAKPDAIFPNNWLTTWPDGRIFLYPMCVPSRRLERRPDIITQLRASYRVSEVTDLAGPETDGRFLESTGVMVFDHTHKVAYANISIRCDELLFREHAKDLGYEAVVLHATDETGMPIYHTNVFMAIQSKSAVICGDALPPQESHQLRARLEASGRVVIDISYAQMRAFAGNVLELKNQQGERLLALSKSAFTTLRPRQRAALSADKQLLPIAIPTIEMVGGGSLRCMIAEIFLPIAFSSILDASK